MHRSHGAGTRVEPKEHLPWRRERVVAARYPPQATARLASLSDILSYLTKFFPHCGAWSQAFLFLGLTNNREL